MKITMIFPLFRLPSVVLIMILKTMELKELCLLSLQSKKSMEWIQYICAKKTLSLQFFFGVSIPGSFLKVHETTGDDSCSFMFPSVEWGYGTSDSTSFIFKKCMNVVLENGNFIVETESNERALLILMEHVSSTCNIRLVSTSRFTSKDGQFVKKTIQLVNKLEIKFESYSDHHNDYNFKKIIRIMPMNNLDIKWPKLSKKQLRYLFKEWLAGRIVNHICFSQIPKHFNINSLWKVYNAVPEVQPNRGSYRVFRDDGKTGIVKCDGYFLEMNILEDIAF